MSANRHKLIGLIVPALVFVTASHSLGQDTAAKLSIPDWSKLQAAYAYEKKPVPVKEEPKEDADYQLAHISFTNSKGQTVPGLFLRPKADGVYPCVLLLHGLGSNKETMTNRFGRALAAKGIASLALDADLHGERKPADGASPRDAMAFGNVMRGGIVDYRMALDYLKTLKDLDSARIGLLGYSMGAFMGSILSGVDDRVKSTMLCVGGDPIKAMISSLPEGIRDAAQSLCPSNYIGHISPRPVFMINGKQDTTVREDAAKLLQDAAKQPKEILWADAGHILPPEIAGKGVDWLVDKLGKK